MILYLKHDFLRESSMTVPLITGGYYGKKSERHNDTECHHGFQYQTGIKQFLNDEEGWPIADSRLPLALF